MRVDETGHERHPGAVDELPAPSTPTQSATRPADRLDTTAFNSDVGHVGEFAGGIEHPDIVEDNFGVSMSADRTAAPTRKVVICHGGSPDCESVSDWSSDYAGPD